MDNGNIIDLTVGTAFLLFTGADSFYLEDSFLEIISKFGVIAVLWFWLKDLRNQMKNLSFTFEKETKEIREEHHKQMQTLLEQQKEHNERIDKIIKNKEK